MTAVTVSFVLVTVIFNTAIIRTVLIMNNYADNVRNYLIAVKITEKMVNENLLSASDYKKIEDKFAQKYGISLCSIYRKTGGYNSNSTVI